MKTLSLLSALILVGTLTAYTTDDLFRAAKTNNTDLAQKVIASGISPMVTDEKYSATPLHYAFGNRAPEVAQVLLDNGADMHAEDVDGEKPLAWWARQIKRSSAADAEWFDGKMRRGI